ncbi:MAG: TolC family protein [Balneolales bacterium]
MKQYYILAVLLVVTMTTAALAQDIRNITLDEAIEIALDNNIEIQLSRSVIERQNSEVRRRQADFFPNLNATVGGSRTIGRQFDPSIVAFDDFTTNNLNARISTGITIFNGFRNINQLRSARLARESAEERYQRVREEIIFESAAMFLDVLLARELLEIERENLEANRRQLEQVQAQVEVGMVPIVNQYSQEAVVANSELAVIRSENNLNMSQLRMTRLLQLDPLLEYEFVTPVIQEEEIEILEYDLGELIHVAMSNRRDVRAAEMEMQQNRYALNVSQGMRLPEVSLSGGISTAYRDQQRQPVLNGSGTEIMPFTDQFFDANINRSLSFNVSIPIFNRRMTSNQIQQNKIDLQNAELEYQDLRQEVFLELRQAYNDYVGYAQELEATESVLIAAEKAYETELERYNVGSATLIELTNANNEYIQASSNRVQALYQFIFQEKVLDFFLGQISEDINFDAFTD